MVEIEGVCKERRRQKSECEKNKGSKSHEHRSCRGWEDPFDGWWREGATWSNRIGAGRIQKLHYLTIGATTRRYTSNLVVVEINLERLIDDGIDIHRSTSILVVVVVAGGFARQMDFFSVSDLSKRVFFLSQRNIFPHVPNGLLGGDRMQHGDSGLLVVVERMQWTTPAA